VSQEAFVVTGRFELDTSGVTRGLSTVKKNVSGSMANFNKEIVAWNRNFSKIASPILQAAKWYMTAVTGLATKALTALYKDDSVAGKAWKRTFDVFRIRLNAEMARVGNLLLQTPIFGRTIPAWMDKLIDVLRRMDLSKVKEMVKLFEKAAIAVAVIKGISIIGKLAAGLTGVGKMIERRSVARGVGESVAFGAAAGVGGVGAWKSITGLITGLPLATRSLNSLGKNWNKFMGFGGAKDKAVPAYKEFIANMKVLWGSAGTSRNPFQKVPLTGQYILPYKNVTEGFKRIADTIQINRIFSDIKPIEKIFIFLKNIGKNIGSVLILPVTLLSVMFYGLRDACAGLKIAFIALRDFLYSIPGAKPLLEATGAVIKNVPKVGAFLGATASGVGGALGTAAGIGKKQTFRELGTSIVAGDTFKKIFGGFDTAAQDFFARNMFKKENAKVEAPDWKSMLPGREKISGQYVGLTEGVKFAQDVANKSEDYLKQIARSTTSLAELAKGEAQ